MVNKSNRRKKIRLGIRKKIKGTAQKPRLSIFRSNKHISCQLIDDVNGVTLGSANSKDAKGSGSELATAVGKSIADVAKSKSIDSVVFDRGGYLFHGRVKALAEAAREGGLQF